uniref:BED-type domain-containing protein n=1 Tax=Spongospora subterranea TaxID=70186 RepID=A0A0H5QJG8_9EUKA|eukprot:CRZ01456.1 hypothetical protein [Spongospora subterranea]
MPSRKRRSVIAEEVPSDNGSYTEVPVEDTASSSDGDVTSEARRSDRSVDLVDAVAVDVEVVPKIRAVKKPKGAIFSHLTRSESNGRISLACNYCRKRWTFTAAEFKKSGSSTGNQTKHMKNMHKKQFSGNDQGNTTLRCGPMDAFVRKTSHIEMQLASNPNVSDALIREALETFVLAETEPFTIVESEPFLTLLKICLKCKRDNVFISFCWLLQT